jgi:hypothetical protein
MSRKLKSDNYDESWAKKQKKKLRAGKNKKKTRSEINYELKNYEERRFKS